MTFFAAANNLTISPTFGDEYEEDLPYLHSLCSFNSRSTDYDVVVVRNFTVLKQQFSIRNYTQAGTSGPFIYSPGL